MNYKKYQKMYHPIPLEDRQWPNNEITHAPIWCSVDLRDGNQALYSPMTTEEKIEFFKFLVKLGFKEIEVGFPAASHTEFEFVRRLIDENLIPDDVTIQVLTQAREHIIKKTVEALKGAKNAIIHLYNSTSTLQREVVFRKSKEEIKRLTVDGKYCEYMQFNAGFLRRQEVMEMARPHLKFISAYWCPVIQKRLRPNWYRNMGHVAWRLNLNGIGYWTSLWRDSIKSTEGARLI